ncbi:hypothetical protein [Actinacidiphila soli]|uniref:hypothetical protein n=1 Tax=Actinacidiphila soli TaxID=2487275 RepID=UPI0013E3621D|nr:hypothetical protein [Actinacidiphila soli]
MAGPTPYKRAIGRGRRKAATAAWSWPTSVIWPGGELAEAMAASMRLPADPTVVCTP